MNLQPIFPLHFLLSINPDFDQLGSNTILLVLARRWCRGKLTSLILKTNKRMKADKQGVWPEINFVLDF